jgi:GntR family transcriptional regulator, carbon starvation induced regulator
MPRTTKPRNPSRTAAAPLIERSPERANGAATVTEAVYARIRSDILLGVLKPGAKLKLESMRDSYEASVNTLRETLSRLVSEGLVSNEGQRGFQVVPASLSDLRDITEMRRLLEVHAARQALERAGLDWESRLVGAYHKLSRIEAVVDDDPRQYGPQLEAFNREFHAVLVSGCGSRWLATFHGIMYDQSLRYRMLAFQVRNFPRDQSRREHKAILEAALARDAEALERVLTTHITKGVEFYGDELLGAPEPAARRAPRAAQSARNDSA